ADVRVVERGLDLVEEVERGRPREEECEQERDRAERLLAAGQELEARHPLARRAEDDLDPRLGFVRAVLRLDELEPAVAAREQRLRDLGEVPRDRLEGVGKTLLDGLGELRPQALELLKAPLEVLALGR